MNLNARVKKLETQTNQGFHPIIVNAGESVEEKQAEYCREHGYDLARFLRGDYGEVHTLAVLYE